MREEMLRSIYVRCSVGVRKGTSISRHVHKPVAKLYRQLISMNLLSFQISIKDYLYGRNTVYYRFSRHCLENRARGNVTKSKYTEKLGLSSISDPV